MQKSELRAIKHSLEITYGLRVLYGGAVGVTAAAHIAVRWSQIAMAVLTHFLRR